VFVIQRKRLSERAEGCRAEYERVCRAQSSARQLCHNTTEAWRSKPLSPAAAKTWTGWLNTLLRGQSPREGRAALVIEDDVVLTDLGPAEVCASKLTDCAALGGWSYATT
jgi:hypothetical protein